MQGEPATERRDAGVTRGFGYLAVWAAILGFAIPVAVAGGMEMCLNTSDSHGQISGGYGALFLVGVTVAAYLLSLLVFVVCSRQQFQRAGRSFAWGCMVGAWIMAAYAVLVLLTPAGRRSFTHDTLVQVLLAMLASALGHGLVMLVACGLIRALGTRRACT